MGLPAVLAARRQLDAGLPLRRRYASSDPFPSPLTPHPIPSPSLLLPLTPLAPAHLLPGTLSIPTHTIRDPPTKCGGRAYVYCPTDPTPSIGGNGIGFLDAGARDQAKLEKRNNKDLLVYTSEPFKVTRTTTTTLPRLVSSRDAA